MVRVSRRLLAAKLALQRSATPQSLRPKPLSLAKYGSRWREARISLLLRLRRLDTGRTACLEAWEALLLVHFSALVLCAQLLSVLVVLNRGLMKLVMVWQQRYDS